jgi:hypothetical protein
LYALVHQLAQPASGIHARRYQFFRVLVAQLVQAEVAAIRQLQCLLQQRRRVQLLKDVEGTQVLLAVAQPLPTQLIDAGVVTDSGHHVVQRFALRVVHLHVAAGQHGDVQFGGKSQPFVIAARFVAMAQVADPEPEPVAAQPPQLPAIGAAAVVVVCRSPDQQAALEVEDDIPQRDLVLALGAAPPGHADQPGEFAVGAATGCDRHQPDTFGQVQLAADDQLDAACPGRHVGLDHPGQ